MQDYLVTHAFELEGMLRLFISAILGGAMGLERTFKRRDAGFRTYILVATGSAMTVLVGELMSVAYPGVDASRIAAAAVSGVGFIGAGSIIVSRSNRVVGLTTAAGIWVSVSVGLAVGFGYYMGGVALTVISVVVNTFGERVQENFLLHSRSVRLSIMFSGESHVLPFMEKLQKDGYRIIGIDMEEAVTNCISATIMISIPKNTKHADVLESIRTMTGIVYAENV